jgi:hypothetical protein
MLLGTMTNNKQARKIPSQKLKNIFYTIKSNISHILLSSVKVSYPLMKLIMIFERRYINQRVILLESKFYTKYSI